MHAAIARGVSVGVLVGIHWGSMNMVLFESKFGRLGVDYLIVYDIEIFRSLLSMSDRLISSFTQLPVAEGHGLI